MNTNMEMNPKALNKRKESCIIKWKKKTGVELQIETGEEDGKELVGTSNGPLQFPGPFLSFPQLNLVSLFA